jgi:hypothetical protein
MLSRQKYLQLSRYYLNLVLLRLNLLLQNWGKYIYKSPVSDEIPAKLVQEKGATLRSEIHNPINSLRNRKIYLISERSLLLYQLNENGVKTYCSYYRGILLSAPYKILSNSLLSKLSPYVD